MDIDVFPNSLEYWGPTGMVFFRNVQVRWMPIQGDTRLTLGARAAGRVGRRRPARRPYRAAERQGPDRRCPTSPASTAAAARAATSRRPGMLGQMKWDDLLDDAFDLSGSATRWGINLSSNVKFGDSDHAARCSSSTAKASRTT